MELTNLLMHDYMPIRVNSDAYLQGLQPRHIRHSKSHFTLRVKIMKIWSHIEPTIGFEKVFIRYNFVPRSEFDFRNSMEYFVGLRPSKFNSKWCRIGSKLF